MSEVKSPLASVLDSIKDAANNFRPKDSKTKDQDDTNLTVDLGDEIQVEPIHASATDDQRREPNASVDVDVLEADVIEGKATRKRTIGERFTNLTKAQKVFVFVLVAAAAMVIKNQVDTFPGLSGSEHPAAAQGAAPTPTPAATDKPPHELDLEGTAHEKLELPASDLDKTLPPSSMEATANGHSKAIGFDTSGDLDLGAPATAEMTDDASANKEAPTFSLNGSFGDGALKSDAQLALEAQTQHQSGAGLQQGLDDVPPGLKPSALNVNVSSPAPANTPQKLQAPASTTQPTNGAVQTQAAQIKGEANPFGKGSTEIAAEPIGFDTRIGGDASSKLDSGKPVLGNTEVNAEVAKLKSDLEAKDRSITDLEGKLKQANADLEAAKKQKPSQNHSLPAKKPERQLAAKSAVPTHKVAQVSPVKALPRPQLCVGAVAEPARNCSTCVAHAFITNRGQSTMVGQGDYIDGYRVSIQGDRLDLQDDKGQVAHKFWSSPDGCKSI
jgi:hypothetical protein